jgi:AcrR family transcriptional regulator
MSPRTSEQYGLIRQEKRKLILDSALELFAENGYHATSISQIAKKAGISKGLAYNYFESKKELLDEIILSDIENFIIFFDINKDGILTEEEFEYFIRQSFKLVRENRAHWRLYYALTLQPAISETLQTEYLNLAEPFFKMMLEFIKTKNHEDPQGDMMVISAMLKGAFLYSVVAPDYFPQEVMEEKIIAEISRIINKNSKP